MARLAQSAGRKALNLVVVGSSPTVGVLARRTPGEGMQATAWTLLCLALSRTPIYVRRVHM
jgi:hypothetical protein